MGLEFHSGSQIMRAPPIMTTQGNWTIPKMATRSLSQVSVDPPDIAILMATIQPIF